MASDLVEQIEACVAVAGSAGNGLSTAWGVKQGNYALYDPMFTESTARRLAELSMAHPDNDWDAQSMLLEAEGFDLADPSEQAGKRRRVHP